MSVTRVAVIAAIGTFAAPSFADVSVAKCASSYANAQLARNHGKLLEAREQARVCASPACPAVGRADCATWIAELDRAIPSVVVVAHGDEAQAARAPRVFVDGTERPEAAAGRAIELDPGEHTFRVEREGDVPVEQVVAVYQGERDRILRFELRPARAPAPSPPPSSAPQAPEAPAASNPSYAPAIIFGALGVAALGTSAWLGFTGRSDLSNLRSTCAPACSNDEVDPVRRKLVASDILLGVGAAASIVGLYFVVRPPGARASSQAAVRVELRGPTLQVGAAF